MNEKFNHLMKEGDACLNRHEFVRASVFFARAESLRPDQLEPSAKKKIALLYDEAKELGGKKSTKELAANKKELAEQYGRKIISTMNIPGRTQAAVEGVANLMSFFNSVGKRERVEERLMNNGPTKTR